MTVSNVWMVNFINSTLIPYNVDKYITMEKTMCIYYSPSTIIDLRKVWIYNQIWYWDQTQSGMVVVNADMQLWDNGDYTGLRDYVADQIPLIAGNSYDY